MNGSGSIADLAVAAAENAIRSGEFDAAIEGVIVDTLRRRDDGLSRIGFILKMAIEMMDCCGRPMRLQEAKRLAFRAYEQLKRDCGIKAFGDPAYAWDGAAARLIAHEYEIDYWEASS